MVLCGGLFAKYHQEKCLLVAYALKTIIVPVLQFLQIYPQHFPAASLSENIFPVQKLSPHSLCSAELKYKQKHDLNTQVSCVKL